MSAEYIEKAALSAFSIHTDEVALRKILKTAQEYAEKIFHWFESQPEKYNFVGDPEVPEDEPMMRFSGWEMHRISDMMPLSKLKEGKTQEEIYNMLQEREDPEPGRTYNHALGEAPPLKIRPLFGSTFIINCRMVKGYEGTRMVFEEVTRRFEIGKPEPNRKFY